MKQRSDFDKVNKWIIVCLILHNLMIEFNDHEWPEDDDEEILENVEVMHHNNHLLENGNQLRLQVENTVLAWYHNNALQESLNKADK